MVRLTSILPIMTAAIGLAAGSVVQVVDGARFVTSGPAHEADWTQYWHATSRTALHTLKTLLGPDKLKALLAPEIAKGDAFWKSVVANSTGGSWSAAKGRTTAYLPDVTAAGFARWFASPLADAANLDANAEHYYKSTTADAATGVITSEIIEGWGGVVTHFTVPSFAPVNQTEESPLYPMLDRLPDFPVQFAGEKTLLDGTVFGVLHIAVRDVDTRTDDSERGIEVYAAVWYGDAADEAHLETERQHMIIEEINLTRQFQADMNAGKFPKPE